MRYVYVRLHMNGIVTDTDTAQLPGFLLRTSVRTLNVAA